MDTSIAFGMLHAAGEAFLIIIEPMRLAVLCCAAFLGVILGIVPGIGGLAGTALLLPFTFSMDPYTAFAFLLGLASTTSTGDPIPAILFGVPGGASSAATVLDGLPMARRGEAGRALSAAYMSSLMGGLFGALLLGISVPILRPVMLFIGTPEMLAISILGLSMVAALSGAAPLRGIAAAAIGITVSMIGSEPRTGVFRWTFDSLYLWQGVPLVPVTLGIFALPELCEMAIARLALKSDEKINVNHRALEGAKDCFRNWWLVVRCSWIGTSLGAIPGIGGAVVDWVSYAHAARTVKGGRETFGTGDVRGVIASEAANNAKEGGSLITMVAFGIPGTAGMAILLGAFLSQGLVPGPDMLTKNLSITYSMVWSVALANILGAGLCYAFSGLFSRVATLRFTLVLPIVACIIFIGAFEGSRQWGDLISLLIFGALGWTMKRLRWPRAPLILGVVLGATVERQLFISIRLYGVEWLSRPAVIALLALAIFGILRPMLASMLAARKAGRRAFRLAPPRLALSDAFPALLLMVFGFLMFLTVGWSPATYLVPRIVTAVGILTIGASLLNGIFTRGVVAAEGDRPAGIHMDNVQEHDHLSNAQVLKRAFGFLAWMLGFLASMATMGLLPTILWFVVAYMRIEGRESWKVVLPIAFGLVVFVYVLFDQMLTIPWPNTYLGSIFPALQAIPTVR